MSIRVVTDSTCDLPASIIAELQITVLPLYINIGKKGYLDGVDMSRQQFYEGLPTFSSHPQTAAPGSDTFRHVYEGLAKEGASEILSIHIAKQLSATIEVAHLGARETKALPVTVFDSRQLSLGMGFLVQRAAQAAAEGHTMPDILALLEQLVSRTYVFAALDTLEYLRRSGRMNSVVARLGTFLQIKPLLKMYDGTASSERVRTRQRAMTRLTRLLQDVGTLEEVALIHTNAPERVKALRQQAADLLPLGDLTTVNITPVIGAHVGPGAVGFACIARS